MIAPARRAATDVSVSVDSGRQDLATALADAHGGLSDARDRALLTELATGVQRWRLALDFAIHALTGRQVADLDPEVRATLRLGLYQLQHASRTPPSAVVNDAVEIVKRGPTRSASGLVNAVLRRVLRDGAPRLPDAPRVAVDDPAWRSQALAYLAITHSHPAWLVERWLDRVGFESAESWVRYDNTPADVTVWPLTRDVAGPAAPLDVAGAPTRFVPGGVVLTRGSDAMPLLREARAYAQDEASAAVAVVTGAIATGRVLDACASPGGKTIAMRPWLPAEARPIAADLRARRVALLAATLRRAGSAVPVVRSDARHLPFARTIDTLLIDAPCSGLGTLRREPDLRWRRTPGDQAAQVTLQRALVEEGLRVLAPGGRLIYATCSSEPEENEDLVAAVLAAHPDWQLLDLRTVALPASMAPLVSAHGWLRTWPYLHGLDAFFAAVLQRRL
ncbi:MAG TPA: transcription antitermination factor NusB [Luteitalea sp.]|nr:transcription antitermination factor NusB [Luteitalea sp.]